MANNPSGPGNIKDKSENLGAAAGRSVGEGLAQGQQAASKMGQKAQDLTHQAQQAASEFGHKAQEAASAAAGRAEDALSSVGDRMSSLAGSIREKAPHEGMVGSAASRVADQLESGGHYLQEHGFREMTEDLTAVIRRHPVQAVFIALGVGFFAGMASRR